MRKQVAHFKADLTVVLKLVVSGELRKVIDVQTIFLLII